MSQNQDKVVEVETSPTGRYVRFNTKLGSGAFKMVYAAYDSETGIEVAWNIIPFDRVTSEAEKKRIEGEWRLLRSLHHPHIINFFDAWKNNDQNQLCFTTEVVTSGSLKKYINRLKKTPKLKVFKRWCRQILNALTYLHGHEPPVIHRDLKCDNIFMNGSTGEVRIGDFGLSVQKRSDEGVAQSVLGTPEFMAPELYDESYNELVDIYAFGMCVIEMVSKEYPFEECNSPVQIWKRVSSKNPQQKFPQVLERIRNEDVRNFIKLCLGPSSQRPSAAELLEHPFLRNIDIDPANNISVFTVPIGQPLDTAPPPPNPSMSSGSISQVSPNASANPPAPTPVAATARTKTLHSVNVEIDGIDDNIAHIVLSIQFKTGDGISKKKQKIKFDFDFKKDSGEAIAKELVAALELPEPAKTTNMIQKIIDSKVADGLQAYKISQQAASVDPAPVSSVSTTPLPPTGETTNTGQQGEKAADKVQETPSTETASETAFQQPVKGPPGGMPLDSTPSLSVDEPIDLSSDPSSELRPPHIQVSNPPDSSPAPSPSVVSSSPNNPNNATSLKAKNQQMLQMMASRKKAPGPTSTMSVKQLKKRCYELGGTKMEVESVFEKQDLKILMQRLQESSEKKERQERGGFNPLANISHANEKPPASSTLADNAQASASAQHTPEKVSPDPVAPTSEKSQSTGPGVEPADGIQEPPDHADPKLKKQFLELQRRQREFETERRDYKRKLSMQAEQKMANMMRALASEKTKTPPKSAKNLRPYKSEPIKAEPTVKLASDVIPSAGGKAPPHDEDASDSGKVSLTEEELAEEAKQKVEQEAQVAEANILGDIMNSL